MADILFVCQKGGEAAGCIDRIQVSVPFVKQATDKLGNPLYNAQTRQPIIVPDPNAAWNWVRSLPFPFPPNGHFTGFIRNPFTPPDHGPPIVLIHHITEPTTSERFVNAGQPDATPTGDASEILPPPKADQRTNWGGPNGQLQRPDPWEAIDQSGLGKTTDTMMGEVDAQGGTFVDLNPMEDQERQRVLDTRAAPPKPKLTKEIVLGFARQWYTDIDPATRKPRWKVDPNFAMKETYKRLAATKTYDLSA